MRSISRIGPIPKKQDFFCYVSQNEIKRVILGRTLSLMPDDVLFINPLLVYSLFECKNDPIWHDFLLTTPLLVCYLFECEHSIVRHDVVYLQQCFPLFFLFLILYCFHMLLLESMTVSTPIFYLYYCIAGKVVQSGENLLIQSSQS